MAFGTRAKKTEVPPIAQTAEASPSSSEESMFGSLSTTTNSDVDESFWGEIADLNTVTLPTEIIAKQSTHLTELTNGLLELVIVKDGTTSGQIYVYDVYVSLCNEEKGKRLSNDRKRLFKLTHDTNIYPAKLNSEVGTLNVTGDSERDFRDILKTMLQSEEVHKQLMLFVAAARLENV